jgi:hypothetical protein
MSPSSRNLGGHATPDEAEAFLAVVFDELNPEGVPGKQHSGSSPQGKDTASDPAAIHNLKEAKAILKSAMHKILKIHQPDLDSLTPAEVDNLYSTFMKKLTPQMVSQLLRNAPIVMAGAPAYLKRKAQADLDRGSPKRSKARSPSHARGSSAITTQSSAETRKSTSTDRGRSPPRAPRSMRESDAPERKQEALPPRDAPSRSHSPDPIYRKRTQDRPHRSGRADDRRMSIPEVHPDDPSATSQVATSASTLDYGPQPALEWASQAQNTLPLPAQIQEQTDRETARLGSVLEEGEIPSVPHTRAGSRDQLEKDAQSSLSKHAGAAPAEHATIVDPPGASRDAHSQPLSSKPTVHLINQNSTGDRPSTSAKEDACPPSPPVPSVPLIESPMVVGSHIGTSLSRILKIDFCIDGLNVDAVRRWNSRWLKFE